MIIYNSQKFFDGLWYLLNKYTDLHGGVFGNKDEITPLILDQLDWFEALTGDLLKWE